MGFRMARKGRVDESSGAVTGLAAASSPASPPQSRETVRLTVQISRELHRRLRLASVLQGETLTAMVSKWISETAPEA